ncbi:MAG: hypothetical protein GY929_15715, partial [Actinomycetia bacterium]|nr:hypothetical protein [Actinomycetes bacterium]
RITDAGSGESIVPIPSGQSAWNADESLLLLYRQGSGFELRDGRTGSPVADLDINPADIEEIYWSPTDPALLTYVDGVELVAFDVNSSTRQILHTFDGCADVHSNGPVPPSADGQLWGLLCIDDTGAVSPVAYRLGDGIDHRMAAEADAAVAPIPTRSGLGLLVSRPGRGLDLYDPTLTDVIGSFPLIEDANVIAAVDGDGAEVIVSTAFNSGPTGVGAAVAHPLDGSDPWPVVGEQTGHGTPPSGTHFASGGLGTSERFAITNRAVPQDGQPGVVDGEILLVDLSGPEPTIVRLAHHRTLGGDYFSYPFVSLSPQGDRLLFSSDWGGDHVDTYLVDIPTK